MYQSRASSSKQEKGREVPKSSRGLIVGVFWAIMGGMLAFFAAREFRAQGIAPKKTIEVLREDKIWLQSEAGNRV